jgi:hypothetical protein
MKLLRIPLLFVLATPIFAQLTEEQRVTDFLHLSGLYAKQYAPYEWKRDTQGFDLLNAGSWLERARMAKNDLDFYEVMVEYVASLNDAHDAYSLPSNFIARLNFGVDIYDGKVLVEGINRARLPVTEFPFRIGYELVSIDGVAVEELIRRFNKYAIAANPRSTRRFAANYLTVRPQQIMPHAVDVGDVAKVVMRRPDGETESYTIPWTKTGLPLLNNGPVPTPGGSVARKRAAPADRDWRSVLRDLQRVRVNRPEAIIGFGARAPIFAPPAGFEQRLGRVAADNFYSGTFRAGGYRIGFLRIPDYEPANEDTAINQFFNEITFFEANTDGLIIDDMRNPGGFVHIANIYLGLLMPTKYRVTGFEIRATSEWVSDISSAVESARAQGAAEWEIALLGQILKEIGEANASNRGRTGPLPLDDITLDRDPFTDGRGRPIAYTKPLMVLIDELSASGGDAFPAMVQDNKRGILYGYRTMGAGGSVSGAYAGPYSEGFTSITQSLMNRQNDVITADYPAAPYVENIGVHPDIESDYMTVDNLLQNGRPFVDGFVSTMVDHITRSRK